MTNNIINNHISDEYMILYQALTDGELRKSLKSQTGLDPGYMDLLRMMDDPVYIKMLNANTSSPGAATPRHNDDLKMARDYAAAMYPEGMALIKEYEQTTNSMVRNGDTVAVNVGPSGHLVYLFAVPIVVVYVY